ncbi:MAG: hypothetical protein HYX54_00515 [Chloroflexi bacterium]|nr:hypothetical protein [Chloroflexota bacterium]
MTIDVDSSAPATRYVAEADSDAAQARLDALRLAAAERAGGGSLPLLTFDLPLPQAARAIGFTVIDA